MFWEAGSDLRTTVPFGGGGGEAWGEGGIAKSLKILDFLGFTKQKLDFFLIFIVLLKVFLCLGWKTSILLSKTKNVVTKTYDLLSKTKGLLYQINVLLSKTKNLVTKTNDLLSKTNNLHTKTTDLLSKTCVFSKILSKTYGFA